MDLIFGKIGRHMKTARLSAKIPYARFWRKNRPAHSCSAGTQVGYKGKFKQMFDKAQFQNQNLNHNIKRKIRPPRTQSAGQLYHKELDLSSIIFSSNCTKKPRRPIRGFLSVLFYWLAVDGQSSAYSYRRRLRYSSPWMGLVKPTPQMLYDTPGTVGGT